jgi:hypothetical protein
MVMLRTNKVPNECKCPFTGRAGYLRLDHKMFNMKLCPIITMATIAMFKEQAD